MRSGNLQLTFAKLLVSVLLCEPLERGYNESHHLFLEFVFPLFVVCQNSRIPVSLGDFFQRFEEPGELVLDPCFLVFRIIGEAT